MGPCYCGPLFDSGGFCSVGPCCAYLVHNCYVLVSRLRAPKENLGQFRLEECKYVLLGERYECLHGGCR